MRWFEPILVKPLWVMSSVDSKLSETELIRIKKIESYPCLMEWNVSLRALTFALLWGHFGHTVRFFVNKRKRQRSAPPFFAYLLIHPFRIFPKISSQGHLRSGHLVRASDPISQNTCDNFAASHFKGSMRIFQEFIRISLPRKLISRNVDFGDLSSGQFCDLAITRQWENAQMPLIPNV